MAGESSVDREPGQVTMATTEAHDDLPVGTEGIQILNLDLSRLVGKPTICIGENKDADQLRGDCEADHRLCFRYSDSTIPLLLKSEISSFQLFSVLVQGGLCQTWSETTLLVFPRGGSFISIDV